MRRYTSANAILQTFFLTTALWLAACGGGSSGAGPNGEAFSRDAGGTDPSIVDPNNPSGDDDSLVNLDDVPPGGETPTQCNGGPCVSVDAGPYCGNGIVDPDERGEQCDDGNAKGGDGCSGTCTRVEPNFTCPTPGQPCVNTVVCGNGVRDTGEGCDDLNIAAGDGCNSVCSLEPGWTCPAAGQPCVKLQSCGDKRIAAGELCDDGNLNNGDGCDANCAIEAGYRCRYRGLEIGSFCEVVAVCGDGSKSATEECDDGNPTDGDCCSSTCRLEGNFCTCPPEGGACQDTSACGNGVLEKVELCDDGNLTPGDGCSETCTVEEGFQCRMAGQACVVLCGDGLIKGAEECDDLNTADADGCSSVCLIEPGWSCTPGAACVASVCGNGTVEAGESCDAGEFNGLFLGDGLAPNHGSGCSKTCTWEPACRDAAGTTTRCTTVCGDGNWETGEGCDDGNLVDNDGCSATCTVEPGFQCPAVEYSDIGECTEGSGDCLILPITFRDFDGAQVASTGHPDFFYLGENGVTCVPNASGVPVQRVNAGTADNSGCYDSDSTDLCAELVAPTLGPNGKPVVNPASDLSCDCRFTDWDSGKIITASNGEQCWSGDASPFFIEDRVKVIDSAESFAQWYTNDPAVSTTVVGILELESVGGNQYTFTSSDGETVYDDINDGGPLDSGFFPLDGQDGVGSTQLCNLWPYWEITGNEACETGGDVQSQWDMMDGAAVEGIDGREHNFYFTSEVRYLFKFEGGEELSFFGDDDVWVFINGKLVLDLGAPHERLRGAVSISMDGTSAEYEIEAIDVSDGGSISVGDGTVSGLGMEVGGTYEITVFHADRHPRESNYELTLSGFSTNVSDCVPDCGDGVRAGVEECDNGAANADGLYNGCTLSCRFGPFCGDGEVNGDEQCDNGRNTTVTAGEPNGCAPGCVMPPACGDGFPAAGEDCDDGAANLPLSYTPTQTCNTDCQINPYCGDGVINPEGNEQCDDGANVGGYGFCDVGCVLGPRCGDGVVQNQPEIDGSAEQCDDGNTIDDDDCSNSCGVPGWCGDGLVQAQLGEQCDLGTTEAGNDGSYGGCNPDCTAAPYCGDGALQSENGEECDYGDGNDPPGDATYGGCLNNCKLGPHCGDGAAHAQEQCDDGNDNDRDGCSNACQTQAF